MENFDIDKDLEIDEAIYIDTFSLVTQSEKRMLSKEILLNETFNSKKSSLYSSINSDVLSNFLEAIQDLNVIIDIKRYTLFYLEIACLFQSINIINYIFDSLKFNPKYGNFYFVKLCIKYNLINVFENLIMERKINAFEEETENGDSSLCFTVKYNRMAMMYKLLNTLDKKQQTKESILLVQHALLTKNTSIMNLLFLHDYIDIKLIDNMYFEV